MSKAFCSRKCKDDYFQLIAIQVPKLWLRRINRIDCPDEKEKEIVEFANRHKWRLDLLKTKIDGDVLKIETNLYTHSI